MSGGVGSIEVNVAEIHILSSRLKVEVDLKKRLNKVILTYIEVWM